MEFYLNTFMKTRHHCDQAIRSAKTKNMFSLFTICIIVSNHTYIYGYICIYTVYLYKHIPFKLLYIFMCPRTCYLVQSCHVTWYKSLIKVSGTPPDKTVLQYY